MDRRRLLLTSLAGILATPLAAEAQATRLYRIGVVSPTSPFLGNPVDAFRNALAEIGYVERRNVVIEVRYAEGRQERLPGLVAELIRLKVDVLVAASTISALAAKRATTTVPIVFVGLIDPVASGLVASLARPGGNITGVTFGIGGAGFAGKWVELLKEAVPGLSHIAALWNSENPASGPPVPEMQAAARTLSLRLDVLDAANPTKLDQAFTTIGASGAQGVIVTPDPFFNVSRTQLLQFVARRRLAAIYYIRDFVEAGGLMSYGASLSDSFRRAATYVDRILQGAKPADLPVEQPSKFELLINLKTAKALGLTIPPSLLLRADQVIDP
jgi:putative tryptophan/tyrosine transport system substrate-binding protein